MSQSNQQQGNPGSTGASGSPNMPVLSQECTEEIESLTHIRDLLFIVAYSSNGKPEQVVLAAGKTPGKQACDPGPAEYSATSGTCGGGKPMLTCKWVNIGGTMYWVCA